MRIRRYTGKDMQEVLAKVKQDLGSEAVILNSRKVKKKGLFGWFSKPVLEVLAAIDEADLRPAAKTPVAKSGVLSGTVPASPKPATNFSVHGVPAGSSASPGFGVPAGSGASSGFGVPAGSGAPVATETSVGETDPGIQALQSKLANMETMIGQLMKAAQQAGTTPSTSVQPVDAQQNPLFQVQTTLAPQANTGEPIIPIFPRVRPATAEPRVAAFPSFAQEPTATNGMPSTSSASSPAGMPNAGATSSPAGMSNAGAAAAPAGMTAADAASVRMEMPADRSMSASAGREEAPEPALFKRVRRRLTDAEVEDGLADKILGKIRDNPPTPLTEENLLRACARILLAVLGEPETIRLRDDGRTTVAMLIGPTGVGKTTTLAKIAAEFAIGKGKRVGLITADTYRIAAVEQLKTYAEILNIPVKVVYAADEMGKAISEFSDRDLVLIDTAGRSHRNRGQFDELRTLVRQTAADELLLVLSSNTGRAACKEILEHYGYLGSFKLLFTKLDEAMVPGIIVNARFKTGRPLSYTTAGQTVPDDLDVANPKELVAGIVGRQALG